MGRKGWLCEQAALGSDPASAHLWEGPFSHLLRPSLSACDLAPLPPAHHAVAKSVCFRPRRATSKPARWNLVGSMGSSETNKGTSPGVPHCQTHARRRSLTNALARRRLIDRTPGVPHCPRLTNASPYPSWRSNALRRRSLPRCFSSVGTTWAPDASRPKTVILTYPRRELHPVVTSIFGV